MPTLRDRDQEWLTEIAKLGKDVASEAGGSNNVQAAIVEAVILVMSQQDAARRATYQFTDISSTPPGNVMVKRGL